MAFNITETEAVYKNLIEPTVEATGFHSVKINEVEHNGYIDELLMRALNCADIAIADLTFARPSVYYEAGYAERKINVIYTCRRDHLSNSKDDLKVHFDLEHRSIIDWENKHDEVFSSRLFKRIKFLTKGVAAAARAELDDYLKNLDSSFANPHYSPHKIKGSGRDPVMELLVQGYKKPSLEDKSFEDLVTDSIILLINNFRRVNEKVVTKEITEIAFQNAMREYISFIEVQLKYYNECYKHAPFRLKIFLAPQLRTIYDLYLQVVQVCFQRPSTKYSQYYESIVGELKRIAITLEENARSIE